MVLRCNINAFCLVAEKAMTTEKKWCSQESLPSTQGGRGGRDPCPPCLHPHHCTITLPSLPTSVFLHHLRWRWKEATTHLRRRSRLSRCPRTLHSPKRTRPTTVAVRWVVGTVAGSHIRPLAPQASTRSPPSHRSLWEPESHWQRSLRRLPLLCRLPLQLLPPRLPK